MMSWSQEETVWYIPKQDMLVVFNPYAGLLGSSLYTEEDGKEIGVMMARNGKWIPTTLSNLRKSEAVLVGKL